MNKPEFGDVIVDIPGNPEKHIQRPPAGWEVVGEVIDHFSDGALIRAKEYGVYARANREALTSLPQAAVREALADQPCAGDQ